MALHATQRIPIIIGPPLYGGGGSGTYTLSAAARRTAFSFIAWQAKTLDSVRFFCSGTNGAPIAANAQCTLNADSSIGVPGTVLETKTLDANPVNITWGQWSGFTTALTAGARYWFVHSNVNATPATNNFGWLHASGGTVAGDYGMYQSGTRGWGWNKLESSDSGTTWGAANLDGAIMRIRYSDGSYDGTGIQSIGVVAAANCIYDKRELGSVLTVPSGLNAYIRRVSGTVWKAGTPGGNVRCRIYRGTSLLGTSYAIPVGNLDTAAQSFEFGFSSSILVNGGDVIRVVWGVTATGDTSTNRYQLQEYQVENDANSKLLKPFDGTISRTETADYTAGTISWTDTDTSYIPFALGLDTATDFGAGSGGGGVPHLVGRGLAGGL
jgi:hypothetical protein